MAFVVFAEIILKYLPALKKVREGRKWKFGKYISIIIYFAK